MKTADDEALRSRRFDSGLECWIFERVHRHAINRIETFKLGDAYHCTIASVDPGARFVRTQGATREEVERQALEHGLRGALDREEFVLHYQPKMNLESGVMSGAEALIRWQHPDRGLLTPAQFVSIAEDSGLIIPLGQWVLREACRQAQAWQDAGLGPVPVAVNVSAVEFRNTGFLKGVRGILDQTRLEPSCLELEVTERALMAHGDSTVAVLRGLKALGVQLAIDDFGTGYSSLSYLKEFPIDALKVDGSFVGGITNDLRGPSIVSAVINLGKSLNQRVIAEGIETAEQLAFLRAQHCGEGQGYYFGRPLAADQFVELLAPAIPGAPKIATPPYQSNINS